MIDNTTSQNADVGSSAELALPAALTDAPNPWSLLKALRYRWRLALGIGMVISILAAAASLYFMPPPKQTARAMMFVPLGNPFLFRTSEPIPNPQDHARSQIAMVKSRLVLNSALKDPQVAGLSILRDKSDPIEWLERELQADFNGAPDVLRIAVAGDNGDELVTLVKAIRKAYEIEILEKDRSVRAERLRTLGEIRLKKESELRIRREEQRRFEQLAGGRDQGARGMQQAFRQQQLNYLERELLQTQSELRRARADLAASVINETNAATAQLPESLIEDQLAKEPSLQSLRGRIQELRAVFGATVNVATAGENNPKAKEIHQKIYDEEQALALLRKKLEPGVVEDLRQRVRYDITRNKVSAETRIAVAQEDEKVLAAEIERVRETIKDKSENSVRADIEREDSTSLEVMTRKIMDEEEALKIEIGVPARHKVLEEGIVIKPTDTKRAYIVAAGVGLGTWAAVLLGFALVEFRARRVYTPDEVAFGLGLPMIGSIPDTESKASGSETKPGDSNYVNEAVDTFRTMLLRAGQHEALRVVMITSAQSGEGKTTISTQLAASLAQVGHKTLLIDGDLRNPIAHRLFGLRRGPGLCEVLRGECEIDSVIQQTPVNNLSMITAGRWDSESSRVLAQDSTRQLVNRLRERFDFIIVDTSPVLPVVDSLLFGQYADAAIISVLREVSRIPSVYAAYQRLADGGIHVLGAVMNGVRIDRYGVRYPYASYAADQNLASEPMEVVAGSR